MAQIQVPSWAVWVAGKRVVLDDLPLVLWEELCDRTGQPWQNFNPAVTPHAARVTYELVLRHLGVPHAEDAARKLTPREVVAAIDLVSEAVQTPDSADV